MKDQKKSVIHLRSYPYPYRAMMTVCSDLDETANKDVYFDILKFLNTKEETSMGPGVGLEVGNSIYFDMPQDQFAYWNTDDTGKEMIRTLIKSGHIDCLHSYGDHAVTREHAGRALDELGRYDCKLQVWIDHGTAVTNFDPDIMQGHGDEPGHVAYHADLTTGYGIKFVWCGRVTSITGQDIKSNHGGIFRWSSPIKSVLTLCKEVVKRILALNGNRTYAMHGTNETLRATVLRDGNAVYEFMRCNPHWGGVSSCDQGRFIGEVLTDDMLADLVSRGGSCVLYTHLGKVDNPDVPFNERAVDAFRRLGRKFASGNILVTTTRRLLGYRRAVSEISYDTLQDQRGLCIAVNTQNKNSIGTLSFEDLSGLTFYVPDPEHTFMTVDGQDINDLERNGPDHTGQASVSLPWKLLEFPKI